MASTPNAPRKRPRQKRAQATVDAILDASAELLVSLGYDKLSTNKVAQRAGVSVGSLYQYFGNKESIVMALVERHTDRMLALLEDKIAEFIDAPLEDGVRSYVRAMMEAHAQDPELHKVMVQQVLHLGFEAIDGLEQRARDLVRVILEVKRDEILPQDPDLAAFVLVTTVESLAHRSFLSTSVDRNALTDEICDVVLRYLRGAS
jgi:AcrR family transcriptional regulator